MIEINKRDVLEWANDYSGEKFHAMFCDPPYHLTSIVERFGKNGSAPAKDKDGVFQRSSKGFMGQEWDGGDVAFLPETWAALGEHLLPGALGMAFASSRGWHRMAVAIEDAGMIIHPSIFGWVQGSGFPKASNPEKVLKKRGADGSVFDGYRYGAQALKPAIEPIIAFQKPFGNVQIDNILRYGTGVYDIDRNRIGGDAWQWGTQTDITGGGFGNRRPSDGSVFNKNVIGGQNGRWPANFYLQHEPGCKCIGYRDDQYQINRFVDGAKPWGDAKGEKFDSDEAGGKVLVWECVDGCPIRLLDGQSGNLKSGRFEPHHKITSEWGYHGGERSELPLSNTIGDSGGASRFFFQSHWELEQQDPVFYCAKAARSEKDAGLDKSPKKFLATMGDGIGAREHNPNEPSAWVRNNHPTVKPLALCKHLAGLLLPPQEYSPRRLLVPFSGTGSEMIGAFQAGWDDIVGIELSQEYIDLATDRIDFWTQQPPLF